MGSLHMLPRVYCRVSEGHTGRRHSDVLVYTALHTGGGGGFKGTNSSGARLGCCCIEWLCLTEQRSQFTDVWDQTTLQGRAKLFRSLRGSKIDPAK